MPVPTDFSSLDTNANNNSPPGTESAKGNIDNYLRQGFAFIKQLYNGSAAPAQATVASAATVDLGGQTSPNVIISGATTITSFGAVAEGIERNVTFSGALTLTHNATSLILPGGVNITTAAGDCATFLSLGGGNWRCTNYLAGTPVAPKAAFGTNTTQVATTSFVQDAVFAGTFSQSWQDVKASRAINTTYTNNTGRPIGVSIAIANTVANSTVSADLVVNGASIALNSNIAAGNVGFTTVPVFGIVPAGQTYSVSVTQGSLSRWLELR